MVNYLAKELVSSSEIAKKFGGYLEKVKSNELQKIAVLKNSSIEAILLSKENYEELENIKSLLKNDFQKRDTLIISSKEDSQEFDLPKELFKMKRLKHLTIKDSGIKKLPKKIKNLINLQTLDISESGIIKLPEEICNLKNLVELHLNDNIVLSEEMAKCLKDIIRKDTVELQILEEFVEEKGYSAEQNPISMSLEDIYKLVERFGLKIIIDKDPLKEFLPIQHRVLLAENELDFLTAYFDLEEESWLKYGDYDGDITICYKEYLSKSDNEIYKDIVDEKERKRVSKEILQMRYKETQKLRDYVLSIRVYGLTKYPNMSEEYDTSHIPFFIQSLTLHYLNENKFFGNLDFYPSEWKHNNRIYQVQKLDKFLIAVTKLFITLKEQIINRISFADFLLADNVNLKTEHQEKVKQMFLADFPEITE